MHCDRLQLNAIIVLFEKDKQTKTDIWFDDMRAKFFIYKCRINKSKPNVQHFMNEMKYIYNIDKYVHYLEMKSDKFYQNMAIVCKSYKLNLLNM